MELLEEASSTSTNLCDNATTSLISWFDYISLEEFLGSGSFGFVFKAVSGTQTLSAVKIIFMDVIGKSVEELDEDRHRVSREYQLIQGKDHENVLKILKSTDTPFTLEDFEHIKNLSCLRENEGALDFIEYQYTKARRKPIPSFCIQMELCGKTLRQWLNAQTVENPELNQIQCRIIGGLATGLNYLHKNNIMHRDFRPENVMFTYSSTQEFTLPIKIGDFGLCRKVHSEHTKTRTLTPGVGNDSYRAPETTGSNYGKQADLFSLGLVIWEVTQLIKYKDTRTMFYKLVHESKTHLVKQTSQRYKMREVIISLTKRRTQDRSKVIPKYLIQDYEGSILVEGPDEFNWGLSVCKQGDTIELLKDFEDPLHHYAPFQLNTNDVTICVRNSGTPVLRGLLEINANGCTIKHLKFVRLDVNGDDNSITHSAFEELYLKGNKNRMSYCAFGSIQKSEVKISGSYNILEECNVNCPPLGVHVQGASNNLLTTNFVDLEILGVVIKGPNNNIQDFSITLAPAKRITQIRQSNEMLKLLGLTMEMCPLGLITTADSSLCSITNGELKNAFVSGSQHKLTDVIVENTLRLRGNGHSIKNCKIFRLQDESDDSSVEFEQIVV